jgi:hypothetical protein
MWAALSRLWAIVAIQFTRVVLLHVPSYSRSFSSDMATWLWIHSPDNAKLQGSLMNFGACLLRGKEDLRLLLQDAGPLGTTLPNQEATQSRWFVPISDEEARDWLTDLQPELIWRGMEPRQSHHSRLRRPTCRDQCVIGPMDSISKTRLVTIVAKAFRG